MSLKYVHMIFVTASTLLSIGFAAWCFLSPESPKTIGYQVAGVASVFAAIAAVVYGVWVWKKLSHLPPE